MPIEDKKSQGGSGLDEQQVEAVVNRVLATERERGQVNQEMGELRKGIKDANEGLAGLKRLFCTEDGRICFPTQAQLDGYMEEQKKTIEAVDTKLATVVEKINNLKPPKADLPEGVKRLELMTEAKRKTLSDEQNEARDRQVAQNDKVLNQTSNDRFRQMDEQDKDNIANKPNMRQRFIKTLTPAEIKQAMVIGCKGDECKVIRQGMEKEEGLKIYQRNESGDFEPVDQEKKKADFFSS